MPLASDRNSKQMHNQRHLAKSADHCSYQTHSLNNKLLNLARLICTTLYHQIIQHSVSLYRRSQIDINSSYENRNQASMSHACLLARSSIRVMHVQFIIRQYRLTKQTKKISVGLKSPQARHACSVSSYVIIGRGLTNIIFERLLLHTLDPVPT